MKVASNKINYFLIIMLNKWIASTFIFIDYFFVWNVLKSLYQINFRRFRFVILCYGIQCFLRNICNNSKKRYCIYYISRSMLTCKEWTWKTSIWRPPQEWIIWNIVSWNICNNFKWLYCIEIFEQGLGSDLLQSNGSPRTLQYCPSYYGNECNVRS